MPNGRRPTAAMPAPATASWTCTLCAAGPVAVKVTSGDPLQDASDAYERHYAAVHLARTR